MANLETFVVYGALYAQLIFVQLYLQFIGFSPFQASLVSIPGSAIMIALAARFGKLADMHGPRLYLTAGPFLVGIGILMIIPVTEKSDFWTWGVASILVFSAWPCSSRRSRPPPSSPHPASSQGSRQA
jgi:hypothetical protein